MSRPFLPAVLLVGLLAGGCGSTAEPTPEEPGAQLIVGCIGIAEGDCRVIAERTLAVLPGGRGQPVSLQVWLSGCDEPACGQGIANGNVTAEWADGGVPAVIRFAGLRADLKLDPVNDSVWSGVVQPTSKRVEPGAVVQFTLGHCGLLHVVDFDGSFWVPIGQVDLNDLATINAADGQMQLVAPNRAQFTSGGDVVSTLARFPGPKHFWLCA